MKNLTDGSAGLLARALADRYPYQREFAGMKSTHPSLVYYTYMSPLRHENVTTAERAALVVNVLQGLADEHTWGLRVRHLEVVVRDGLIGIEFYADRHGAMNVE